MFISKTLLVLLWATATVQPDARLPDGGHYFGPLREGLLHGDGRLEWPGGDVYVGQFANGVMSGQGRYTTAEGETYEGTFQDGEFRGQGRYTHPDGFWYEGQFEDWQLVGEGAYVDPEGNRYEGNFEAGDLQGHGRYEGVDGEKYVGEFLFSTYHGEGALTLPDGRRFEGTFIAGQPAGEGTWIFPDQDGPRRVSGTWRGEEPWDSEAIRARQEASETAIYTQNELLDNALNRIAPGDPDKVELFLLALAGDGTQEVFRREVDFVINQFDERFGTAGHSIALINSRNTLNTAPMATRTALRRSLKRLADAMNHDDILFLFMTSHGSPEHELYLAGEDFALPDLGADELAEMLDDSGIKWRVIVVSACYSGGFIEPLANRHTMVITAARHDRASFGCEDANEFVYFGRAFFQEAIPATNSFRGAFYHAQELIERWEDQEGIEAHSEPQLMQGPAIQGQLEKWRQDQGS